MVNRASLRRFASTCLLFIAFFGLKAQKDHTSTGTFDLIVPPNMSMADAEKYACDRARDSAVVNIFPQQLATQVQTWVDNGKVSTTVFSTTDLLGEWLGDDRKPDVRTISNSPLTIKCSVKGKVREKPENSAEISVKTLYCPSPVCEIEQFNEGQSLYLRFVSSESGYISVFLDNMEETFQLLPYASERKQGVNQTVVEKNYPYVFFSREDVPDEKRHLVDELELFAEKPGVELISLIVLFSETPFNSPLMTPTDADIFFDTGKFEGFTMPDSVKSLEFNRWLLRLRQTNPGLRAVQKMITVRR